MRVFDTKFFFAALALLGALTGCATPQYQTSTRLIAPADVHGQACVLACDTQQTACQQTCQSRYQACTQAIEPQVESRYTEALQRYENELRHYATYLQQYNMQLQFDWLNRYPYRHPHSRYPGFAPGFPPPYPAPVMPTREEVRAQLQTTECNAAWAACRRMTRVLWVVADSVRSRYGASRIAQPANESSA